MCLHSVHAKGVQMCFFASGGEGMRMRIMGKSLFLQKKEEKTGFRLKVGVCFFSRGTAQNFKGD